MKQLFHITRVLSDSELTELNRILLDNDAILLAQDGVYQLIKGLPNCESIYLLAEDADARGLSVDEIEVIRIDYPKMVELTVEHDAILNW
ncbi:sulfurtransferase complex subunit TusB [Catenovulum sp. SM1970]|uniref:sulfurtransferase complex subunit TusB n=1 Tax=Marinifaba aquimaris TaxID=2741323 RepID=UPI0015749DAD|nr:sulfurtransferase complex subunit TusB [Marinifaba aquimaris]NTS75242.1 sulfurtransferase complex subunit TusB [Marinifaba aquimaris]